MLAGETASYNGYQYCLFPMSYIYCTQVSGPNSYSHCCGHPADWIGSYNVFPYYAPCDCHRIETIASNGQTTYTSDNQVWTPSGLSYVTFLFAHDDNIPSQTSFRQGELIGHTGTFGGALGDHVHIDQSLVKDDQSVYYGITCQYGNPCAALQYSALPTDVFYITGNETIVQTLGNNFQTVPSQPTPPIPPHPSSRKGMPLWMKYMTAHGGYLIKIK